MSVRGYFRSGEESAKLAAMQNTLRIVVFQEGEWLCAHCLELDFATQAKNLDDLRYDLERMIVGHIAICLENGLRPFKGVRRAPKKYWDLFKQSKISLPPQSFGLKIRKRGVKVPTPEIRVAPLAA
jgi:hypothetical protein